MCGRFAQTGSMQDLMEEFEIVENLSNLDPSFNIAPGQEISAIIFDGKNKLVKLRWGLVPAWAKDPAIGDKLINARSETLSEKPSFKHSFKRRRCLIPANGFFEWIKDDKIKIPVYIKASDDKPFAFAGLYDIWTSSTGKKIATCTIITTEASQAMEHIHNRMPVIVSRENSKLWLDCTNSEQLTLPLFDSKNYPDLTIFPVTKNVNSPQYNQRDCIEEIKDQKD